MSTTKEGFKANFRYRDSEGNLQTHSMEIFAETKADAEERIKEVCLEHGFWTKGIYVSPFRITSGKLVRSWL